MGFRLWGRTESDTTEVTSQQQQQQQCAMKSTNCYCDVDKPRLLCVHKELDLDVCLWVDKATVRTVYKNSQAEPKYSLCKKEIISL